MSRDGQRVSRGRNQREIVAVAVLSALGGTLLAFGMWRARGTRRKDERPEPAAAPPR